MTPRAQYEADGFHNHAQSALSADLIQAAIDGQEALCRGEYETGTPPQSSYWNPGDDAKKLVKIEMPQIANRAIMEVISHSEIGRIAAEITGAEQVQVWWVQMLGKPSIARDESADTNIGWHQDRNYWQIWEEGSELLTAWIALTDVTADSGPMRFVKRSHRWGFLDGASDFYGQDHESQREEIGLPEGETWEEVAAILPPGGVSFHHNLTLHASGPNHSGSMRRSFAIHLRTEKSRPVNDQRAGLTQFIDNTDYCPVIYGG